MPISPLPEDAVRHLGSATVITTPASLVKELLENAIDAGATSIDILMSQNAVDRIEVRDNGNGIHSDDYESLGRPGHTSKLTSLEELRTVGATMFGFRGQALASANTLGDITVTTMTSQDSTAVKLKLRHGLGGVESLERTSAPVGTAVCVTALFSRLPVRRQVILRDPQKSIVDVKHMLRAYALARPHIRLSFKVVGGSLNQSWSYAPRPQSSVREAVIQVFGAGVMSQCLLQALASEMGTDVSESHGNPELALDAVLPKPNADLSKLSKGPFFSVDSRPITTQHGIGKKMLATFRTQFKKSRRDDELRNLNDLFVQVNIKCSPGSYDPNVEPSKNEVLFADESQVVDLFERLCTGLYKDQGPRSAFVAIEKRQLLDRIQTRTPPPSSDGPEAGDDPAFLCSDHEAAGGTSQPSQMPMSSLSSPFRAAPSSALTQPGQQAQETQDLQHNPKTRHEFQSPLLDNVLGSSTPRQMQLVQVPTLAVSGRDTNREYSRMETPDLQMEQTEVATKDASLRGVQVGIPCHPADFSKQSHKRGFEVDMSADPDMSSDEEAEIIASRFRELQNANNQLDEQNEHSKEGLNPWVIAKLTAPTRPRVADSGVSTGASQSSNHQHEQTSSSRVREEFEEELPVLRPLGASPGDLDPPRTMRLGHPHLGFHHTSPATDTRPAQVSSDLANYNMSWLPSEPASSVGRCLLPDLRANSDDADEMVDPDGLVQTRLSFGGSERTRKKRNNQRQIHVDEIPEIPNPPFRRPKKLGGRNRHVPEDEPFRPPSNDWGSPMPAPSRPQVSRQAQEPRVRDFDTSQTEETRIDTNVMRRQPSDAEHQSRARQPMKRTKSERLPLETIPQGNEVQHLVLVMNTDIESLERHQKEDTEDRANEDESLCNTIDLEDVAELEERLKRVLSVWAEKTLGETTEADINLRTAMKRRSVST